MLFTRSSEFKKKLKKLPKKLQDKVVERLRIFVIDKFDPSLNNHPLHGEYTNHRSINIAGDLRVIYKEINKEEYFLVRVDTHANLYG